ncbi:MAG: phosphoribosylformylglycinamidine synthase subunit PurL [Thermoproteota archaeon]|nr:phosphoribosylformylglycinamidine synthase subunit PurL [Thermoproteota archaeon]
MLSHIENDYLTGKLGRKPNPLELDMTSAEWSEHCSYKSSKKLLKLLPTTGNRLVVGPGYDAGVVDVGNGDVITVHIESHNHPSAIDPYGGAATGVGGVIRDIISMGTRPIGLLNALRFAPIEEDGISSSSKWLFKNVVRGIADYGNCIGIPTVGGEVEFDTCFREYCLVDVAAIGLGRKDEIIPNKAENDDVLVLAGNPTGRDGLHGASFASKSLEEDRSAVQIPDPFLEKLLIEATREAVKRGCIKAIKDLGGGGLACCLSELSDSVGMGFEVELSSIHKKIPFLLPNEIMISESQERMLYIACKNKHHELKRILDRFGIPNSTIGTVKDHTDLVILLNGKSIAKMKSSLLANAPLAHRKSIRPSYLNNIRKYFVEPAEAEDYDAVILKMLSNPNIASKRWVYQQYDHEVGIRTLVKPGEGDASVLRIDNDRFISLKLDGNSKHCYLDPYKGTLGCLSEACRNIRCTGATPIGIVDHLQFGNPERPGIYWAFRKSVEAIAHFCKFMSIPVVGGKVSFYNETSRGAIKPSPVIGALGLIRGRANISRSKLKSGDSLFIIGLTAEEMGGTEYFENYHKRVGGRVAELDLNKDLLHGNSVLQLIRQKITNCVHDCSKGGLAISLVEMALRGNTGISIDLERIPNTCTRLDYLLFSETNSRYIFATKKTSEAKRILDQVGCSYSEIGHAGDCKRSIQLKHAKNRTINIPLVKARAMYESIGVLMGG